MKQSTMNTVTNANIRIFLIDGTLITLEKTDEYLIGVEGVIVRVHEVNPKNNLEKRTVIYTFPAIQIRCIQEWSEES